MKNSELKAEKEGSSLKFIDEEINEEPTSTETLVQMEKMRAEYEAKIAEMERKSYESEFYHALERGISKLNGRNWRAVCPLLDLQELCLNEHGEVDGLLEQIERIKESDGYLFFEAETTKAVTGNAYSFPRKASGGRANPWSREGYNLTEQGRMIKEEPEKARRLMMQAGV